MASLSTDYIARIRRRAALALCHSTDLRNMASGWPQGSVPLSQRRKKKF